MTEHFFKDHYHNPTRYFNVTSYTSRWEIVILFQKLCHIRKQLDDHHEYHKMIHSKAYSAINFVQKFRFSTNLKHFKRWIRPKRGSSGQRLNFRLNIVTKVLVQGKRGRERERVRSVRGERESVCVWERELETQTSFCKNNYEVKKNLHLLSIIIAYKRLAEKVFCPFKRI